MSYCHTLLVHINNERELKEFSLERKINKNKAELKFLMGKFKELENKIKAKEAKISSLESQLEKLI